MNGTWYHLSFLNALWLLPLFAAIQAYTAWKRRKALRIFTGTPMLAKLTASFSPEMRLLKHGLFLLAILFLILAIARPAWNPVPQTVKREGRDVVFLLDVSRSMLADDLKPSRLERARLAIDDCLEVLQGDRVALAVFAGTTVVKCPLTLDYGFFRMMLTDVSPDSVSRGGTLMGDALRKVMKEVFDGQDTQFKDIVLITDGEDHESFPLEAARSLGEAGIRLIAVGLGNEEGTPIMLPDANGRKSLLKYRGEIVRTKLDSATLQSMATATPGGRYLPVATGNIELDKIYQELIASAAKRELESVETERFEEKFQIFLLLSMLCLALESLISDRRNSAKMALFLLCGCLSLQAGSSEKLFKEGNRAFAQKDFATAESHYKAASEQVPDAPQPLFNQGLAAYKQGNFANAATLFEQAAEKATLEEYEDDALVAQARLGMGNACFKESQQQREAKELSKAAELCQQGIHAYQEVLNLQPRSPQAMKNLKLARHALKQINQELEQQRQEQQQQSDQMKELSEKQQDAAQKSSQVQQNSSQNDPQQMLENQENISKETKELAEKQGENSGAVQKKLEEALDQQKQAEEALKKQDYKEAEKHQKAAAEKLKEASKEQEKQADGNSKNENSTGEKAEEKQDQPESKASGEEENSEAGEENPPERFNLSEDASDILDEERKNQRQRRMMLPAEIRPVEKDW